jgi:hypothetical protein
MEASRPAPQVAHRDGPPLALLLRRLTLRLRELTENSDNKWAVCAHGGVTTLLRAVPDATNGGVRKVRRQCIDSSVAVYRQLMHSTSTATGRKEQALTASRPTGAVDGV